jgi:hypothetical protein
MMQHIQGISRNQLLGVPDLLAKLHAWNSPYKRKFLFWVKTTYLKLFLTQIIFGTNQNTPKCNLA